MVSDRMTFLIYSPDKFRIPLCIPANAEKTGPGTAGFQDIQYLLCNPGRRTIIKREKDFIPKHTEIPRKAVIDLFNQCRCLRRLHFYCI
jgi:hypothetical protein